MPFKMMTDPDGDSECDYKCDTFHSNSLEMTLLMDSLQHELSSSAAD